ncbi:MAG: O-antigen ligase family protein [Actinomycetota bacterium]|nr:O-antigen ligase family protein [Actinomycetota bacterium]
MIRRRTVGSYAIFWLLGIAFLWWPWLLLRVLRDRRPATRRPVALGITTLCLAVSLLIAAASLAAPSRLVGALANLSVWVTLWRVLASEPNRAEADGVLRGIVDLALFQGVLVIVARAVYPTLAGATLPLARLLPSSLAGDANVAAFSTVRLAIPDYYNGVVIRTSGIFGNPTWAGAVAAVGILFVLFASDSLSPWMRRPVVRAALVIFMAVTLYYAYARIDLLGLGVAAFAVLAVKAKAFIHPSLWMASICAATATVLVVVPLLPLNALFGQFNKPRQGSLVAREEIYGPTLTAISHAATPLLGAGIKERVEGLVASLGTHSTYFGLAYRGGLLAAAAFVVFLVALGVRSFGKSSGLAVGLVCFLLLWCVSDDIDAGHLLPLVLVVIHGSMGSRHETDVSGQGPRKMSWVPIRRQTMRT